MQAAIGLAQLDKLDSFIAARRANFVSLRSRMLPLEEFLILPEATAQSDPSWFGFPITLRESVTFDRVDLLRFLDQRKIGTRLLFAGNLTRQPYFAGRPHRISGTLLNADTIMQSTFWVGVWPGLKQAHLDYIADSIAEFCGANF
jgi:CDP-6-deoxy-D-xylo-4-hexulose-3-dehydrase